jgi:hypothetical protein
LLHSFGIATRKSCRNYQQNKYLSPSQLKQISLFPLFC